VIDRNLRALRLRLRVGRARRVLRPASRVDARASRATVHGDASDPAWWSAEERLLIRMADKLHDSASLSDELWDALATAFSVEQILADRAGRLLSHGFVLRQRPEAAG